MLNDTIAKEVTRLKKEKNAVILAHYYTDGAVQALADFVGDSFYLAKQAAKTNADILVFCGVAFMAESAKIINPQKKVLMPDTSADCPMAHMADAERIAEMRRKYDDLAVVCYINSTTTLKCLSDVCVTSSNAIKIVNSLPNKNIFFIPDKNLGRYVAEQLPEKNIILNDGFCPIHNSVTANDVITAKSAHPYATVLAHPECQKDVLALADYIGSTAEMLDYAEKSDAKQFIICTEDGVSYPLTRNNTNKEFFFVKENFRCANMKLITPEKVLNALKNESGEITVCDEIIKKAVLPLDKMLELGR